MKPPFSVKKLVRKVGINCLTECVGASLRASHSARHARRPGWHVVKGQGHRDAGVIAHQGDYVGDADMAECLDRTVIEPLWDPTRISEGHRHLVDNLLALVRERSLQAGDDGFDLIGWQTDFLAAPLMRVGREGRMPFAVDDADGDLALAFGKGVMPGWKWAPSGPRGLRQFRIVHP